MKEITEWKHLEQYGIEYLTAEADGISLRALCDVSEKGKRLITDFFGMKEISLFENRNPRVGDSPAIGSLFIPHSTFLDLAAFCLLQDFDAVIIVNYQENKEKGWYKNRCVTGFTSSEFDNFKMREQVYNYRVVVKYGTAPGGFRNVHQWTGRVE